MFLRQFERDALIACVAMALAALLMPFGGPWAALGVLGGGGLAGVSYRGLKAGVYGSIGAGSGRGGGAGEVFHKVCYAGGRGVRYAGAFAPARVGRRSRCVLAGGGCRQCRRAGVRSTSGRGNPK